MNPAGVPPLYEMLEGVPFGVCVIDENFNVLFWNRTISGWSGVENDNIIGKNLLDRYPGLKKKRYYNRLKDVMRGGPPAIFSPQLHPHFFNMPNNDGELRILRTMVSSVTDAKSHKPVTMICVDDMTRQVRQLEKITRLRQQAMDEITERRKVEEALKQSQEKFQAHYKGIPIPTYSWEKIGESFILADYNDAADKITKGKIKSYVGKKADEMLSDMPESLEIIKRCYNERKDFEADTSFLTKSRAEIKDLDVKYAFVPPDFVMVHVEDITARRKAEREKENLIIELNEALDKIKTLHGIIPICAHCKNIRDDKGSWNQLEQYITTHSEAQFSHGICPDCMKELYPDYHPKKK